MLHRELHNPYENPNSFELGVERTRAIIAACAERLDAIDTGFYKVHTPFTGFKKALAIHDASSQHNRAVVLTIPVGAVVFFDPWGDTLKMRASEAIVDSIYRYAPPHCTNLEVAVSTKQFMPQFLIETGLAASMHDPSFIYCVGDTVTPARGFSYTSDTCQSGIHFFAEAISALTY